MTNKNLFIGDEEIKQGEKEAKSACVVLLSPHGDGSILAMTKKKDLADIGLPGGKIEFDKNEHPTEAAVRECFEETGILVDLNSLVPIYSGLGRTMVSMTYLATKMLGGKLLPISREGLPMWVHPHMLLKETCSYSQYNLIVYKRLVSAGIL